MGFSVLNQPQFAASFTDKSSINGIDYAVGMTALAANGACPIADMFSVPFVGQAVELVQDGFTQLPTTVNAGFCLNAYFFIYDVNTSALVSVAYANASNI